MFLQSGVYELEVLVPVVAPAMSSRRSHRSRVGTGLGVGSISFQMQQRQRMSPLLPALMTVSPASVSSALSILEKHTAVLASSFSFDFGHFSFCSSLFSNLSLSFRDSIS
jgi:hypothetical protein